MGQWLLEPFALGFQQRALLGGAVAGVMCAVVGTWLVLRGMSFFGDAFVHGIIPGIAAAVVFDFSPILGAAVAAVVMVAGIELVHRQTALKEDTGIGLLFVGMLALGVVIISTTDTYAGSLTTILFGDVLGVTAAGVAQSAALAVVVIVVALLLYRPLLALAFDRTKADALGMRPARTHALLLVGPPATAALVARTVPMMMLLAVGIALVSVWLGLVLSFHLGTAGSATMALVPIAAFFVTLAVTRLRRRSPAAAPAPA